MADVGTGVAGVAAEYDAGSLRILPSYVILDSGYVKCPSWILQLQL